MSTIVLGLSISMTLMIMASGLMLIFGMMGIMNFSHGSLYALGAFVSYQVIAWTGSFVAALIAAPLIVAAVCALLEITTLRPIYDQDHSQQMLLTFGITLMLDEGVRSIWGLDFRYVSPPSYLNFPIELLGSKVPAYRVFVIVIGIVTSALFYYGIERTRLGMIVRAASSDPVMTRALGIDDKKVRTVVFAVGASLAALGGAIMAPLVPVVSDMGFAIIMDCFVVVIVGGLGSVTGVVAAALFVGLSRAGCYQFFPLWTEYINFMLLIGVMIIRPQGLFGRKLRTA